MISYCSNSKYSQVSEINLIELCRHKSLELLITVINFVMYLRTEQ